MIRTAIVLLITLGASACDPDMTNYELNGHTMGTTFNVQVIGPSESLDLDAVQTDIRALLETINSIASTYDENSELSLLNDSTVTAEWLQVSPELCHLVRAATDLGRQTDGAYDVTVGGLVDLWGFGPDDREVGVPSDDEIQSELEHVGYQKIEADCRQPAIRKQNAVLRIDLSSSAKGYAVDRIADLLEEKGVDNFIVEIGGELRFKGRNAKRALFAIAIEDPLVGEVMSHTVLNLTDSSVATSGDYRNFFEHEGRLYSHTIDPRTGYPVEHDLASVTVIARSAELADGLATGLLVMGQLDGSKFAEDRGLAAMFQMRVGAGVSRQKTKDFIKLTAK